MTRPRGTDTMGKETTIVRPAGVGRLVLESSCPDLAARWNGNPVRPYLVTLQSFSGLLIAFELSVVPPRFEIVLALIARAFGKGGQPHGLPRISGPHELIVDRSLSYHGRLSKPLGAMGVKLTCGSPFEPVIRARGERLHHAIQNHCFASLPGCPTVADLPFEALLTLEEIEAVLLRWAIHHNDRLVAHDNGHEESQEASHHG
jgi:hypothetical protein